MPKFNHPTWSHAASAIVLQPRARDRLRAVLILAIYVWSIPPRGKGGAREGRGEAKRGSRWTACSGWSGVPELQSFGKDTMSHLDLLKFEHPSFKSFTVNFQYTKQVLLFQNRTRIQWCCVWWHNRSKTVWDANQMKRIFDGRHIGWQISRNYFGFTNCRHKFSFTKSDWIRISMTQHMTESCN